MHLLSLTFFLSLQHILPLSCSLSSYLFLPPLLSLFPRFSCPFHFLSLFKPPPFSPLICTIWYCFPLAFSPFASSLTFPVLSSCPLSFHLLSFHPSIPPTSPHLSSHLLPVIPTFITSYWLCTISFTTSTLPLLSSSLFVSPVTTSIVTFHLASYCFVSSHLYPLLVSPFTSSFVSSPPVSSPVLASPILLPLLSSAVVLHFSVHRKPICVAIPPVLTDAHRVCVYVCVRVGGSDSSFCTQTKRLGLFWWLLSAMWGTASGKKGGRRRDREGGRERAHSGTGCRGIQMSVGVLEKQKSTKQAARCQSYPLCARSLVPSRTRKRAHTHMPALSTRWDTGWAAQRW